MLETVTDKLYTPYGLRSLAPDDPHYRPVYRGNSFEHDSAYHQGTAWSVAEILRAYIEDLQD